MLFWTDNKTEPKKINIPRSIEGTYTNGHAHTRLINSAQGITLSSNVLAKEEHITVIKRAPINALGMVVQSTRDSSKRYTAIVEISINDSSVFNSFTYLQ